MSDFQQGEEERVMVVVLSVSYRMRTTLLCDNIT